MRATLSKFAVRSWGLKSIAGMLVMAAGVVGIHGSTSTAIRDSGGHERPSEQSRHCRHSRNDGDDDEHRRHEGRRRTPPAGTRQTIVVNVPSTTFLRVDKSGRVTAAATNTGCPPRRPDDVYLFLPDGTIEPTTAINLDAFDWTGNFSVPGRFQPQTRQADHDGCGEKGGRDRCVGDPHPHESHSLRAQRSPR